MGRVAPRRRVVGVAASVLGIAVVATVGGCSSDRALTRSEYRRAAQAVCRATREATPPAPSTTDVAALREAGRRSVTRQRHALEAIQGLDAPTQDEQRVGAWLDVVRRTLETADASLDAQERGDLAAADQANSQGALLAARADELASRLALTDCLADAT
jgi:hypothetical protein